MGLVSAASLSAQLANASTAATGLGGAFTARASGYNAVYWNPANLAMPGNPGFSLTFGAVDGNAGTHPIDLKKVADAGSTLSDAVRQQWLLDVQGEGSQRGDLGGGVTELGLSMGSLAFQVNTKVATQTDLGPGAVEAVLFGNRGQDSTVHSIDLTNSGFAASAYSTGAVSYGMRLPIIPLSGFTIGATAKYTVGHGVGIAQTNSSIGTGSQIDIQFPYIRPSQAAVDAKETNMGSGFGLDLGAAWRVPGFRFGVSMQNVVNTFKWDTTKLATRTAVGLFSDNQDPQFDGGSDASETAFSTAPTELRDRVMKQKFKPVFAAGMSFDWLPKITVSADIRQQVQGGIESGPESMMSAGAEVRWIPMVPLRGGVQMMTGGFGLAGGVGLHLLGFEAGIAGYVRTRNGAQESGATINVLSIRP
jgi:hypothetical protein